MRQLLMYLLALSSWRTPLLWDWSSVCVWERADCWVSRAQGELATPCGVLPPHPPPSVWAHRRPTHAFRNYMPVMVR